MDINPQEEKELIDDIAEKTATLIGENQPIRRIRKSQIMSALIGAVGFSLFIDGILKLVVSVPAIINILIGLVLMSATGVLLRNLNR